MLLGKQKPRNIKEFGFFQRHFYLIVSITLIAFLAFFIAWSLSFLVKAINKSFSIQKPESTAHFNLKDINRLKEKLNR